MQSLASNPGGSVYGQPGQMGMGDEMQLVNNLKDREMRDFKNKAAFMADLSLKQERMRDMYDPAKMKAQMSLTGYTPPGMQQGQAGMNVVMGHDPNQITGFQKAELGQREKELGVRQSQVAQQGRLGQEALDIKSKQEALNQQKSDQINTAKQAEHERKIAEANAKLEHAQNVLQQRTESAEAQLKAHKDLAAAVEERHKAEMAMREHQFNTTSEQHNRTIASLEEQVKQKGKTTTKTSVNPEGTTKTTETRRGSAADTVQVTGKDGQTYEIPADKEEEWNATHAPEGEQ